MALGLPWIAFQVLTKLGYPPALAGEDVHKRDHTRVPKLGGTVFLIGILPALAIAYHVTGLRVIIVAAGMISLIYAIGLYDDIRGYGGSHRPTRWKLLKLFIPAVAAAPVLFVPVPPLFGLPEYVPFQNSLLAITYVMVCGNLLNIYSYYNGHSVSIALLCLVAILLRGPLDSGLFLVSFISAAGLASVLPLHWVPARVFPGDSGDYTWGFLLGFLLVGGGNSWGGLVLLLPLILNFVIVMTWLMVPNGIPFARHGTIDAEGYIVAPNPVPIPWLLPYYLRLREQTTVLLLLLVQVPFAIAFVLLV